MKTRSPIPMRFHARWLLLLALLAVPLSSFAQWQAKAGAQSPDCLVGGDADLKLALGCEARQAMAFIPNFALFHAIIGPCRKLSTAGNGAQECVRLFIGTLKAGLRLAVGEKRQQDRNSHEHRGDAEHPVRRELPIVSDLTAEYGADVSLLAGRVDEPVRAER